MNRLILAAMLALAGCRAAPAPTTAATPPLAGSSIGGPFALTDQNGRAVSDRDFKGRYRIVYFGYTFCPDVCPTDAQAIGAAMRMLDASDPALSARIVPLFITVDPARDTPAVLKQFVGAFYPRMIGLTGSPETIARTAKEFKVWYAKGGSTSGGYLVNHTRQTYLMGPDGQPLALLPTDQGPRAVADEIKRWTT